MMNKFIALLGSNATGKSTRMTEYVHTLGQPDKVLDYHFHKNGEDRVIKCTGHIYNTTLVVGRPNRKGKWVGGDHTLGKLGSTTCIKEFFTHLDSIGIENVVYESYFGAGSTVLHPDQLRTYFKESHTYWFLYDSLQEFTDRTESRSGSTWEAKGKVASQSVGWKSDKSFHKLLARTTLQVEDTDSTVQRVSIDVPKTWFIEEMKKYNL